MNSLIVVWQDPISREWIPIGILRRTEEGYVFVYTAGAQCAENFSPFPRMADLKQRYVSPELFPVFANRLMRPSRPDFQDYLHWFGLEEDDPMLILARSEGIKATDGLQVYPCPEPTTENLYEVYFFCHGIRYMPEAEQLRVSQLKFGESLYPMHDFANDHDPNALALRTSDPPSLIGYVPRFLAGDFRNVLMSVKSTMHGIVVLRVNPDAPIQFRLLCKISVPWPKNFSAFSGSLFEPLAAS